MQRVLLYEFVTSGGGFADCTTPPSDSIRREGATMLTALAADFAAVEGVETVVMVDGRAMLDLPGCRVEPVHSSHEEFALLSSRSRQADWTIVIAPEFDDLLRSRCRLVEEAGGRLLGPSSTFVALAADKHQTAEHLSASGVPAPRGIALDAGSPLPAEFPFPAVLKPRFGAGSQDVRRIPHRAALAESLPALAGPSRLEQYCPGIAASVALLCGPAGRFALPPCRQRLRDDVEFRYLGGALPLPPEAATRAVALAERAIAAMPDPFGYVGVDLVLGNEPDGRDDLVIEVNPRLTTSYVGLRALAEVNLAAAMLAVAAGAPARLSFAPHPLEFDADGTIRHLVKSREPL
jgi:tyramine---L-glutamate ligase